MNAETLRKKTHEVLGLGDNLELAVIRRVESKHGMKTGAHVDMVLSVTDDGVHTRDNGHLTFEQIVGGGNTIEFFDDDEPDVVVVA